jgi:predicted DNA-binding transcriptional regulator AlpA
VSEQILRGHLPAGGCDQGVALASVCQRHDVQSKFRK